MSPLYSLAVVAFATATVLLVVAATRAVGTLLVLSRGQSVLARVESRALPDGGVQLRYNTLGGDPIVMPCPAGLRTVAAGDRVVVVYLPWRPGSERVLDNRVLWHHTVVVAVAGLVVAAAGSLALWWAPDPEQPLRDAATEAATHAPATGR